MLDQLTIGTKKSLDDFDASLKQRVIHAPKKKTIKETVPFSNVTYDFSAINGELYWEERELEYVFEIIAPSPEELENKKIRFSGWVMNVMNENIYDPFEPDWHYVGTYESMSFEDDEDVEKTTVTVVFLAYPYKIANEEKVYSWNVAAGETLSKAIENNSSHPIVPQIQAGAQMTVTEYLPEYTVYTVPSGASEDSSFKLKPGETHFKIEHSSNTLKSITFRFYEEVF